MATKKYLDYAGLKRVLKRLLPGARKIWHGTLAEWEALSATEKAKYDQAEVIDDDTGVPVVVDKVESGNLNPVTSNAVAETLDDAVIIKHYNNVTYDLADGQSSEVPRLTPTGWFNTNLKVDVNKVAVVVRYVYTYDSNGGTLAQLVPYNANTNADTGILGLQFLNLRSDTQECVRCRVWFSLIGKAADLPE